MYVQVRTMGGKPVTTLNLSRLCTVADMKLKIQTYLDVEPSRQKLYHRGKHMEDKYKLFDYNVKLNDVVQVLVTSEPQGDEIEFPHSAAGNELVASSSSVDKLASLVEYPTSQYYKVGDLVDCHQMYQVQGAWCEGTIKKILKPEGSKDDVGVVFMVAFTVHDGCDLVDVLPDDLRPRAVTSLKWCDLFVGQTVMVNYNLEEEDARGFWYDLAVTSLHPGDGGGGMVHGTLYVGRDRVPIEQIKARFKYGIMAIEQPHLLADGDREKGEGPTTSQRRVFSRMSAPLCMHCQDNPRLKCKDCSCSVCGGKDEPQTQVLCDECDQAYHMSCLSPQLTDIPDEDWYCPECKNDENEIVKTGDRLKESKRKAKLASSNASCKRDWGHGMATLGRSKVCSIVPPDHFGSVPGIDVGTLWKFRLQASEAGVHRPPVSGIHGRESDGAYSIVLSGGYEDDVDNGDEFMYTGSGGRDLSGNKRTAKQSCNQELTRFNRAIAMNCNAPINDKEGATAKDWKAGKPIRVLRNYKLLKHSKFAPEEGNRYDGLYKVVKYFPVKGKSGFIVWRFQLRRDDPSPAPWTADGKKIMEQNGIQMIYPEGYLEAKAVKEAEDLESSLNKSNLKKSKGRVSNGDKKDKKDTEAKSGKRPLSESASHSPNAKKQKAQVAYKLDKEINDLIKQDRNVKLWDLCKAVLPNGKSAFMAAVTEHFMCVCCLELIYEPVTISCLHNICKGCLKNSFDAKVFTCPSCRLDIGKKYQMEVNAALSAALLKLFPGYHVGR